ncbi:hypothetical protein BaRGS_00001717 [Batillaria attramentaria]|uniref:Uncharacterized protein n=1 Tax=Batillaria attramentaria TaxID=370345 RepID=A0ABD0M681_9CAEN
MQMREALEGKRKMSPYDWRNWYYPPPPRKKGHRIYLPPIDHDLPATTIPKYMRIIILTTTGWYGHKPQIKGRSLVTERCKWTKVETGITSLHKKFGWPDIYD